MHSSHGHLCIRHLELGPARLTHRPGHCKSADRCSPILLSLVAELQLIHPLHQLSQPGYCNLEKQNNYLAACRTALMAFGLGRALTTHLAVLNFILYLISACLAGWALNRYIDSGSSGVFGYSSGIGMHACMHALLFFSTLLLINQL